MAKHTPVEPSPPETPAPATKRSRAKASRRTSLLAEAARPFGVPLGEVFKLMDDL